MRSAVEFHVLRCGRHWVLSRDGKKIANFDTKQQSLEAACDLAQGEEWSSIIVHDSRGHVQRGSPG